MKYYMMYTGMSTLKTRNRLIEAVWRVIVGNDTPEPEACWRYMTKYCSENKQRLEYR